MPQQHLLQCQCQCGGRLLIRACVLVLHHRLCRPVSYQLCPLPSWVLLLELLLCDHLPSQHVLGSRVHVMHNLPGQLDVPCRLWLDLQLLVQQLDILELDLQHGGVHQLWHVSDCRELQPAQHHCLQQLTHHEWAWHEHSGRGRNQVQVQQGEYQSGGLLQLHGSVGLGLLVVQHRVLLAGQLPQLLSVRGGDVWSHSRDLCLCQMPGWKLLHSGGVCGDHMPCWILLPSGLQCSHCLPCRDV